MLANRYWQSDAGREGPASLSSGHELRSGNRRRRTRLGLERPRYGTAPVWNGLGMEQETEAKPGFVRPRRWADRSGGLGPKSPRRWGPRIAKSQELATLTAPAAPRISPIPGTESGVVRGNVPEPGLPSRPEPGPWFTLNPDSPPGLPFRTPVAKVPGRTQLLFLPS